uniref:Golgi SNAP receptor complex member 2 n=1 Tax=Ditylenchus dipsaci TaxID=166011 RepID=A0A915CXF9_9BILA
MDSLFQQANKDVHQLHFHLNMIEKATNESEMQPILQNISREMVTVKANLDKIYNLVGKEPPTQRRAYKYRLDQLRYDYNGVDSAVLGLQAKMTSKWRAAAERDELLTRRFKANDTHVDFNDAEYLVHDKMKQSHGAVDDLLAQGTAILGSLRSQHASLHGVKRKVLDIGQTLGLSTTTLRMIEKRLEEDWLIFLILCVVFLVFMYCFYRYWKG